MPISKPREFDSGLFGPENPVSKETAFIWAKRLSSFLGTDAKEKSLFKLTPTALAEFCTISNGHGGCIGSEILYWNESPVLLGCAFEIVEPVKPLECRFAFVNSLDEDLQWFYFASPGVVRTEPRSHEKLLYDNDLDRQKWLDAYCARQFK